MFIAGGAACDALAVVLARVFMAGAVDGVGAGVTLGDRRFFLRCERGRALCSWAGMAVVVIVTVCDRVGRGMSPEDGITLESGCRGGSTLGSGCVA